MLSGADTHIPNVLGQNAILCVPDLRIKQILCGDTYTLFLLARSQITFV